MDNLPDKRTQEITSQRVKLPISKKSIAAIEAAGGLPFVCGLIGDGMTHKAIAARLGIARSDLSGWLVNENSPLYWGAMESSSESLLDEAQNVLEAADGTVMASVQRAKAISDLYIRRAGIRNWRYATRPVEVAIAPVAQAAPPSFRVVVVNGPSYGRTLDQESGPDLHDPDR